MFGNFAAWQFKHGHSMRSTLSHHHWYLRRSAKRHQLFKTIGGVPCAQRRAIRAPRTGTPSQQKYRAEPACQAASPLDRPACWSTLVSLPIAVSACKRMPHRCVPGNQSVNHSVSSTKEGSFRIHFSGLQHATPPSLLAIRYCPLDIPLLLTIRDFCGQP